MNISAQNKKTILLYLCTIIGVVLGFLSSIVNTRFLSPQEYGDVRYIINLINFVASFLLFGYFLSGSRLLALTNDTTESRQIKGVMVIILAIATAVLMLSMAVLSLLHIDNPALGRLFLIAIPICGSNLFMNYIEQTATGDNQMGRLAMARCMPYVIYIPAAYFIYRFYGCTSSLMLFLQLGLYSLVYLIIIVSTRPLFRNIGPSWNLIKEENNKYGIQLYWGSIIMVATNYLAGITLGYFNEDNSNVGFYTLALTVTSPLALLPSIVGTSYFKKFATQDRIPSKVIKVTLGLTLSSGIVFVLLIQPLVTLVYSERYSVVGLYACWLAIGYCIHGLGDMFNRFLCSHGQGVAIRNASFANGIVKIIGLTLLVALWNVNGAIVTVVMCDSIYFICLLFYYKRFVNRNERK